MASGLLLEGKSATEREGKAESLAERGVSWLALKCRFIEQGRVKEGQGCLTSGLHDRARDELIKLSGSITLTLGLALTALVPLTKTIHSHL